MRIHIVTVLLLASCGIWAAELSVEPYGRCAFFRNEPDAKWEIEIVNKGASPLSGVVLRGTVDGQKEVSVSLREINARTSVRVKLPVETRLKTGKYSCLLKVAATENGKEVTVEKNAELLIAPVPYDIMPVVVWGFRSDYRIFKDMGFTHGVESASMIFTRDWEKPPIIRNRMKRYDAVLADEFRILDYCLTPHIPKYRDQFPRYGRDGKPRTGSHNMEASNDGARELCRDISEKTAETFKDHPGLDGLLINSEIRDNTNPSFGKFEPAAFKKFAGFDIPPEVEDKTAPHYSRIKGFPVSRVIPENDPLYVYYRWFWKDGDGWNPLHTLIHESYKKHIKRPFWSFFDPAVRVPPVWGSGGKVDYLSHWTYAYPDPINIGANTSELQAMAAGCPGQGVMNMTQIITYRSVTAPIGQKVANEPGWVGEFPRAPYITLAPDLMREAVWTQISRHVSGIMFHGYDSLIPDPARPNFKKDAGYQCTHLKTKEVLSEFLLQVVRPLGPVLKQIPERKPEVAVLESFPASIFAGRGTWGWSGWIFDANLMLMWANLSPAVVYEETILRDGFGNLKVLVMPHCDVLTEPVFRKIQEFQRKGGILVADEHVVPGITPDIPIREILRSRDPKKDKEALQQAASDLRRQLAPYHRPYSDSTDKDLVTWVRSWKDADYLFVINDKRTFGDYFGPYGLVMEKGLPNRGKVTVKRHAGGVYDLVKHQAVPFESRGGTTTIPVDFSTNDGRLLLILPNAVGKLSLELPGAVKRGQPVRYEVRLADTDGKAVEALIPLRIAVEDADGVATDDSAFAAMKDGVYTGTILPPLNTKPGDWTLSVTELASGKKAGGKLRVE
ncbi:MAG: hypothetical protein BWY31_02553 [Lentisphaerae bacterium ADurb.Bin242]|nr:MAG: hypothetical protein BWY31_02553 [Lentisphaerae bacterium ADurb.Bin242]